MTFPKQTMFTRNTLGATLKRADALNLGDRVLMPSLFDTGVSVETVRALGLVGDDVEVTTDQAEWTTSQGNTLIVLPA